MYNEKGKQCRISCRKQRTRSDSPGVLPLYGMEVCMDSVTQLIASLGFPIVMCLLMFKYMQEESDNHKKEVEALKDSLKENTVVLADLKSMIQTLVNYLRNETDV